MALVGETSSDANEVRLLLLPGLDPDVPPQAENKPVSEKTRHNKALRFFALDSLPVALLTIIFISHGSRSGEDTTTHNRLIL